MAEFGLGISPADAQSGQSLTAACRRRPTPSYVEFQFTFTDSEFWIRKPDLPKVVREGEGQP